MFKYSVLSILLLSLCFGLQAQSTETENHRARLVFSPTENESFLSISQLTAIQAIPLDAEPFLAVNVLWQSNSWTPENWHLQIRFSTDGSNWEPWQTLYPDPHTAFEQPTFLSQLVFAEPKERFFQLGLTGSTAPDAQLELIRIDLYNPGKTEETSQMDGPTPTTLNLEHREFCPCPQPDFEGRLDWCPAGTCPTDATPVSTTVTHLIVHHSAGSNTSSDWAARVRAIWNAHVNSNGWDDIGYNWLIDPNGVLYEGRADNRLGAHFCGTNGGTMGVCMIGTYTDVLPTPEALTTLRNLLSWKSCKETIDPLDFSFHNSSGLNLFHISGHRDGCATECPGETFYATFEDMRVVVDDYIANECSPIPGAVNLEAALILDTVVQLTWNDISDSETGFELERSLGGANDFSLLITLPAEQVYYLDLGLLPMEGYDYRIRAFNDTIASLYSNIASVVPVLSSTTNTQWEADFEVAPNPFTDQVLIRSKRLVDGPFYIKVWSLDGRQEWLSTQAIRQFPVELDLSALPEGMFYLEIQHDQERLLYPILKMK